MEQTKNHYQKKVTFFRLNNKKAGVGGPSLKLLLSIGVIGALILWLTGGAVVGISGMFASPLFWIAVILFAIFWSNRKK